MSNTIRDARKKLRAMYLKGFNAALLAKSVGIFDIPHEIDRRAYRNAFQCGWNRCLRTVQYRVVHTQDQTRLFK